MKTKMKKKLGIIMFPNDWWGSDTEIATAREPKVRLLYINVIMRLLYEQKPVKITWDWLQLRVGFTPLSREVHAKLQALFDVDSNGFWWHRSVEKRIKMSENNSENAKRGWIRNEDGNAVRNATRTATRTAEDKDKNKEKDFSFFGNANSGNPKNIEYNHPLLIETFLKSDASPNESSIFATDTVDHYFMQEIHSWSLMINYMTVLSDKEKRKLMAMAFSFLEWIADENKYDGKNRQEVAAHFTAWAQKPSKFFDDFDLVAETMLRVRQTINGNKKRLGTAL